MGKSFGIKAKRPAELLQREIKADFRALSKALLEGTLDAVKGDWYGAAKGLGKGLLDGLGLKAGSPEELAWHILYASLRQAVLSLIEENRPFFAHVPDGDESLPDELELRFSEIDLRVEPGLLRESWRLPLLRALKVPFIRWLRAFGVDERRAGHVAEQLPQRFGYALWAEWARHREMYKPLDEALSVPVQLPPDLDKLREDYLSYLRDSYHFLDFKGLPGLVEVVEKASGLALRDVYVSIHARRERPVGETWERMPPAPIEGELPAPSQRGQSGDASQSVPLEPLLSEQPALVVLGDPGAGKSTLLKHHALALADDSLGHLPILVPLNQYAQALTKEPLSLRSFLPRYFATRRQSLSGLEPVFEQALENGRAVVLLDGLDEVQEARGELVRRLEDFVRELVPAPDADPLSSPIPAGNRVVVTSRFVGYADAPLTDLRWRVFAVADWDLEGIGRFLERWTRAVELAMAGGQATPEVQDRADEERRSILAAVQANEHIARLAGNPLLLTILALIKRQGVSLPHRRVQLYELYLKTLLDSWRKARALDKTPIGPEIDYDATWYVLAALGLWLRETSPQFGLADERQMREFLVDYFRKQDYPVKEAREEAAAFVRSVHQYSSLLVGRGPEQFGFLHQTFGEYLAGCGLARDPAVSEKLLAHLADPGWRETILLGIGALVVIYKDRPKAAALLADVLDAQQSPDSLGENVLLAGEALRDVDTIIKKSVAERIVSSLVEVMQGVEVKPRRRRRAGLLLGETGWRPQDLDWFQEVPEGRFLYGDDMVETEIQDRYWIGRYPVTNAQFMRFVKDGGYGCEELWSADGWDWRKEQGRQEPYYGEDSDFGNPIFPVVGVTRHEADAYCRWMQARVEQEGFETSDGRKDLPNGYRVQLPTEQEWERAARGTGGREYPWGDGFDLTRANVAKETGEGMLTSAVCTYPGGVSSEGIWDAAGNVFEWTRSPWSEADPNRVVRGGSWRYDQWVARCAFRYRFPPVYFLDVLGFRVVLSLADSGS